MPGRYQTADITRLPDRPVFFDANVIIYIFWPTGSKNWSAPYSKVFKTLLELKREMAIDVTVVSEVINRTLRFEYDKYLADIGTKKPVKFKDFRDGKEGRSALADIQGVFRNTILPRFKVIGKAFLRPDIEVLLSALDLDFSDRLILSICRDNDCILLTNDADFSTTDLDILTCNPKLLRAG